MNIESGDVVRIVRPGHKYEGLEAVCFAPVREQVFVPTNPTGSGVYVRPQDVVVVKKYNS